MFGILWGKILILLDLDSNYQQGMQQKLTIKKLSWVKNKNSFFTYWLLTSCKLMNN